MYAVIDIGSNTMRLSVYSIHGGEIKPVFHRKAMAALISYRDEKGRMTERGINKAISVLPLANRVIDPCYIKKLLKSFYHDEDGINRILRVVPERIHTIIPGMILLKTIAKHYHCEKMIVSEYGVREGYLIKTVIGWRDEEE